MGDTALGVQIKASISYQWSSLALAGFLRELENFSITSFVAHMLSSHPGGLVSLRYAVTLNSIISLPPLSFALLRNWLEISCNLLLPVAHLHKDSSCPCRLTVPKLAYPLSPLAFSCCFRVNVML